MEQCHKPPQNESFIQKDDDVSDNDSVEIVGEQSGTVDSSCVASGGTEVSVKMTKIILTEEPERFAFFFVLFMFSYIPFSESQTL